MEKRQQHPYPIAVDIIDLQAMLGLSKLKSMQVGNDADAVIHLGMRRTLYNVQKVKDYIDAHTGSGAKDGDA